MHIQYVCVPCTSEPILFQSHIIQGCFSARPGPFSSVYVGPILFFQGEGCQSRRARPTYQGGHLRLWHQIHNCFSSRGKKNTQKKLSAPRPSAGPSASGLLRDGERKGRREAKARKSSKISVLLKLLWYFFNSEWYVTDHSDIAVQFNEPYGAAAIQLVNTGSSCEKWVKVRPYESQNLDSSAPSWANAALALFGQNKCFTYYRLKMGIKIIVLHGWVW